MNPAEEIKKAEEMQGKEFVSYSDAEFNPAKNPEVMSIMRQMDGNYKIFGQKNGKFITVRGVKPEDCLMEFLTHE